MTCPTRERARSIPCSCRATTSVIPGTSTIRKTSGLGKPERDELRLQFRRHLFLAGLLHVHPQLRLELVALPAVAATVEMGLGLGVLLGRQLAVHVGLHDLLAVVAAALAESHYDSSPTFSASSRLRIRLPRCRRDMTVPTGMSRICAASA